MNEGELHYCSEDDFFENGKKVNHGEAVHTCYEKESGYLVVCNSEYLNDVNYCPFCGYKAKKGVTK